MAEEERIARLSPWSGRKGRKRGGEINRKKGRNAKGGKKEERAEERRKQNGIAA